MLILCAGIVIAAFILGVDDGRLSLFGYHPPSTCALRSMFGVKCAFCGMTRSVCATAHGQLKSAFGLHPLGPPLFFFVLLQIPYRIYAIAASPRPVNALPTKVGRVLFAALLAAIMVNWLVYLGGLIF
jgi:hypothetical protein